ncbi:MAG: hypothetical protein NT049_13705 [Planctomycetota bacterium]|nr:hypothetical protein [Planctomycetota bacterium]
MIGKVTFLAVAAVAALLVAGCGGGQPSLRPYQTMTDMGAATRAADLIVEGLVVTSEDVEHIPGADVWSNINGRLGQDCIVRTRVKMRITQLVKGPAEAPKEVTFSFYGACFHGDPQVLLGLSLPPVLKQGARMRVYLDRQGEEYWLIAHESLPPPELLQKPAPTP